MQCPLNEFWVPIFKLENKWIDSNTNEVSFLPWAKGEPSVSSECAIVFEGEYYGERCTYEAYFYCLMKSYKLFTLKGICKDFKNGNGLVEVDTEYVFLPKRIINEKPTWIGTMNTFIKWNANNTSWELFNLFEELCYASLQVQNTFPMEKYMALLSNVFMRR